MLLRAACTSLPEACTCSYAGNSDRKPSPTPAQILAPRSSLGVSDASEGSGSTHAPGRVPSSLRVTSGSFPLASDDAVRAKTRENFAAALQKAVEELQSEGAEEAAIGDPVRVAHEVEVALYKLFGESACATQKHELTFCSWLWWDSACIGTESAWCSHGKNGIR